MRTGGASRGTHQSDELSFFDFFSFFDQELGGVAVTGFFAAAMVD
jgi:hypothetical protein